MMLKEIAFTEAQQGIAFQDMMQLQQKVADVVRADPNVLNIMSAIGSPINQGRIFFRLKDKKDRVNHMSAQEIIQELREGVMAGILVHAGVSPDHAGAVSTDLLRQVLEILRAENDFVIVESSSLMRAERSANRSSRRS